MISYKDFTDQELIAVLKQGDPAALTEIHRRYYSILYIHAYRRFPYREEVKDIIQDLFTWLWDNREDVEFKSGLPGYLYTSIRNRLYKIYRHQTVIDRYAGSLAEFMERGEETTQRKVDENEMQALINKEIASLPPATRAIFELSKNEGFTYLEIAEKLNLSPHTVRTQIRNALRILKTKLGVNILFIFF